jgi:hypothetical protein
MAAGALATVVGPDGRASVLAAALAAAVALHAGLAAVAMHWPIAQRPANPLAEALGRQSSAELPDMTESRLAGEVRNVPAVQPLVDDRALFVPRAPRPAAVEVKRPTPDIPLAAPEPTRRPVLSMQLPDPAIRLTDTPRAVTPTPPPPPDVPAPSE